MVYLYVTLAGTLISLGLAVLAWRARPKPGATALAAATIGLAQWNASHLLALQSSGFEATVFWSKLHFLGLSIVVPAIFVLVLEYAGREDLLRPETLGLLLVEPVVTNLTIWTNDMHGLFAEYVRPGSAAAGAGREAGLAVYGAVLANYGPWFWVHAIYLWGLAIVTLCLVAWLAVRRESIYRGQLILIALAILLPLTASILDNVSLTPTRTTEPAFVVTGVLLTVAVVEFDLVDVTPIARNTILDEMTSGILVLDRDDQIVDINPKQRRMLGLDGADVIGRPVRDVLEGMPTMYDHFEGMEQGVDTIAVDTGSETRQYQVRVSPLTDDRGRSVGRVFLTNDVTAEHERRAELERQNQHLDRFASVVSHDLRNPLQAANGNLELALRRDDDEEYLREIEQNHGRMEEIIEDALTLARQGQTIEETATVDLATVAEQAWDNVATPDATFENGLEEVVTADRSRLAQVFENLFRNSMEHAGPDVTIRAGTIALETDTVINAPERGFFVEDDGPGIPEDERRAVFEAGHTDARDGTGLGLAIVQSIVAAHGWTVRVSESDSGGARLEITGLDVHDTDEPADTAEHDSSDGERQTGDTGAHGDSADASDEGHADVATAETGEEEES